MVFFVDPVNYADEDTIFGCDTTKLCADFVGICELFEKHDVTSKLQMCATLKFLCHYNLRC